MKLDYSDYKKRLYACYVGKAVGGTLGMPYEGHIGTLDLDFYSPVPTEMVGNDDLDYQIIWLEAVRRRGLPVNRFHLAGAWLENVRVVWDEYGVAQRNIKKGIMPPLSGAYDNKFDAGLGSAIRSELWACLAPGDPDLAVSLALEDCTVDHSDIGVEATAFWCALESYAFVERKLEALIEKALGYISPEGKFARAVKSTLKWWAECGDVMAVRERILESFPSPNFTDVCINIPFMLLGLLASGGDFGKAICTAVNCGYDTDCIGASVGALMGILNPDGMDEKWTAPLGSELVLSPYIVGMHNVDTLEKFCLQIEDTARRVLDFYGSEIEIAFPESLPVIGRMSEPWKRSSDGISDGISVVALDRRREATLAVLPYIVNIKYHEGVAFGRGESAELSLSVLPVDREADDISLSLRVPDGWRVEPESPELINGRASFTVTAPDGGMLNYVSRLDIRIKERGFQTALSAPLMQKMRWLDSSKDGTRVIETENHFFPVTAGAHIIERKIKCAMTTPGMVLVCDGTREMKVYIDGAEVGSCNGKCYVPACHRSENRALLKLDAGIHDLRLTLPDGDAGEVFIGFFKPYGNEWVDELEGLNATAPDSLMKIR